MISGLASLVFSALLQELDTKAPFLAGCTGAACIPYIMHTQMLDACIAIPARPSIRAEFRNRGFLHGIANYSTAGVSNKDKENDEAGGSIPKLPLKPA